MRSNHKIKNSDERGMVTLDFALAASIYFMMLIAIAAGGTFSGRTTRWWKQRAAARATPPFT